MRQISFNYIVYFFTILILGIDCSNQKNGFHYNWSQQDTRQIGTDFLANRPQDWKINNGKLTTTDRALGSISTVFLGNRKVSAPFKEWTLSVEAGWQDNDISEEKKSMGLMIGGMQTTIPKNLIKGYFFGVQSNGKVFITDLNDSSKKELTSLENTLPLPSTFLLSLTTQYKNNTAYIRFQVQSINKEKTFAELIWECEATSTQGTIGLVADLAEPKTLKGCWFDNFSLTGQSIAVNSYYSLSQIKRLQCHI